jgi:hypothetical protein
MMLKNGKEISRSDFMKELWADPEYAKRQSEAHQGKPSGMKDKHHKAESNEKNRQSHLGKKFTEETFVNHQAGIEKAKSEGRPSGRRKGSVPWNKGLKGAQVGWNKGLTKETSEGLARVSEKLTGRIISQEQRLLASITNTGKKASKVTCQKLSVAGKGNPHLKARGRKLAPDHVENIREGTKKALADPAIRKVLSDKGFATWQDPEYREKQLAAIGKGLGLFPNRPESLLKMILHEYHPTCKYTGDLTVWINGKNPDFVNEETKQVIEVYGDYWHDGEDPTDRAEIFAQAGYETCVIWENELQNLDHVIGKLNRFFRI